MSEVIGFIGLGAMGLGMAGNLARLVKSQQAPASLARKVRMLLTAATQPMRSRAFRALLQVGLR
jgi:3-hydroxyisobutyrate dehydrogenase-like beta-hydroxyacid dehydrogenase